MASPRPIQECVAWLGVRGGPRIRCYLPGSHFGYTVPTEKVADMIARLTEMTTPPSERIDPSAFNPARWIVSINTQLRDWRRVYLYADNSREVFEAIDEHARERVGILLRALTGVRAAQLYERYRIKLPRGFTTWEVPGARLVVLSSLAPQCPGKLIRDPAWARPHRKRQPGKSTVRVVGSTPASPPTPALPALPAPSTEPNADAE